MIREELLALADELESYGPDCDECPALEQAECRGYRECTENVSKYCARRIREAVERDGEGATTVSAYDLLTEKDRKAIEWVRKHGGLGSVKNRLMPEGMKWPRYDTGELVDFSDEVARDDDDGAAAAVDKIVFHGSLWQLFDRYGCEINEDMMGPGEPVKRPAPKVLDADGEEIRNGDVLYSVETGDCVTVGSIEPGNPWFAATDGALEHCAKFTHQRPESWELLEDDAGKNPFDYCKDVGHRLDTCENAERYKARDLVRRAKKLAGVDND